MKPVLQPEDLSQKVVIFSLGTTTNGITINAKDESGGVWVIGTIEPTGLRLNPGIDPSSGIPVDHDGRIETLA